MQSDDIDRYRERGLDLIHEGKILPGIRYRDIDDDVNVAFGTSIASGDRTE